MLARAAHDRPGARGARRTHRPPAPPRHRFHPAGMTSLHRDKDAVAQVLQRPHLTCGAVPFGADNRQFQRGKFTVAQAMGQHQAGTGQGQFPVSAPVLRWSGRPSGSRSFRRGPFLARMKCARQSGPSGTRSPPRGQPHDVALSGRTVQPWVRSAMAGPRMRNLDDTLLFSPNRINVAVSRAAVQALVSGEDVWRWCLAAPVCTRRTSNPSHSQGL